MAEWPFSVLSPAVNKNKAAGIINVKGGGKFNGAYHQMTPSNTRQLRFIGLLGPFIFTIVNLKKRPSITPSASYSMGSCPICYPCDWHSLPYTVF